MTWFHMAGGAGALGFGWSPSRPPPLGSPNPQKLAAIENGQFGCQCCQKPWPMVKGSEIGFHLILTDAKCSNFNREFKYFESLDILNPTIMEAPWPRSIEPHAFFPTIGHREGEF